MEADSVERLREMIDLSRDGLRQSAEGSHGQLAAGSVIVLGAVIGDKANMVAAVTPDLVKRGLHAGKLVGEIARAIGGSGGGRPELGQAGGGDAGKLQEALDLVTQRVQEALARG
jgi:alanyl-tRNA synthetase